MNIITTKTLPFITIVASLFYWTIDSLFDVYLFNIATSISSSFFTNDVNELWMRFSVISILIIFSLYARTSELTKQALLKDANSISELSDEMKFLETVDPLTLLPNKRKFYELLEYEMDKDKRYKVGLSVIFCGIDNYKTIETNHSHATVDNLLRNIALQFVKILRSSDVVSHWNNDEFLILIPNKTADETKIIAEKIRSSIDNYDFSEINHITTSFGISQYIDSDNKVTIVERAEKALNTAKNNGGNKIELIS